MNVLPHLQAAGIGARQVDVPRRGAGNEIDATVDLRLGDVRARFAVEEKGRAPYPNEIHRLEVIQHNLAKVGTPMLVVPYVSEPLGAALTQAGWSWADAAGNFDLRAPNLVLRQRTTTSPPRPKASRLPQGSGSLGIIRALIGVPQGTNEEPGATGLADQAGVSQPRASQVLHQLQDLDLVSRTRDQRWLPDREALLDRFLAEYRGPGGSTRHLYSLDPPNKVAALVSQQADARALAVSADVGPDLLLPWRRPSVVILYARQVLDLDRLGLVEAQGSHDANVIVRTPDDASVFPSHLLVSDMGGVEVPLADATQQIWDLQDLGGADRLEAAGKLREWLINRP